MLPLDSRVCDFIDVNNKCWDWNLLNRTFLPFEAEAIVRIPLSVRMPDDRQVWVETSNGFFSVRSAYKLALEFETNREIGSCSDGSNIRHFWKRLWSIQIPHKIRHFAWRAARDILPTKENLVCRKVLVDSMCEECGNASGSFFHLFWECSNARNTWISSSLFSSLSLMPFWTFFEFLWYILMDA